jgi:hypothetical protein
MDVATGLQYSQKLSMAAIARHLEGETATKHKIKKVDRLLGNNHLYNELAAIYSGLSDYVFKYICHNTTAPIIVDLCYLKDTHDIQMLSAEVTTKGRSIPLYREVFEINELKGRANDFLSNLSPCIPSGRDILVIMDAGFGDEWLEAIELRNWYWLVRARGGKYLKLSEKEDWKEASELYDDVSSRVKSYANAYITKKQSRPCRVITKKGSSISKRKKPERLPRNYNSANGNYQRSSKEPWILSTNLPSSYTATQVINYYKKRMQIEESFRDLKSTQYGLGGRTIQTRCVYRWGVKMLLAAIAQITLWIIGVVGHSQGYQKKFQPNTVKDKKLYSYFFLGKLIVECNMLDKLNIDYKKLKSTIEAELARVW